MKTGTGAVVLAGFLASGAPAQDVSYFPNLTLGQTQQQHDFVADWYTKQLKALAEPSMLQLANTHAHAYRFLWLRTFHNPVAIRVNVTEHGTSALTVKVTNGKGGYSPGKLVKNDTRNLDKQRTAWFLNMIEKELTNLAGLKLPHDEVY